MVLCYWFLVICLNFGRLLVPGVPWIPTPLHSRKMPRSKLPINFNVLYYCWWNCLASFAKSFFIVQARSNWLHFLWILLKKNNVYSLISIRQNYNFDMLATIWHEIVSWFPTISQDLRNMITKLFISVQDIFMIATNKNGEKSRNLQTMPYQMMAQVSK